MLDDNGQSVSSAVLGNGRYAGRSPVPTQLGPMGIRFDFNHGCRLAMPEAGRHWKVRLRDLDTGTLLHESHLPAGAVYSPKRYYIRFLIEAWLDEDLVFSHEYLAKDREVLIQFPSGTLGDIVGWLPYAAKFRDKHGCRLTCAMEDRLISLFHQAYPDMAFVTHEEVEPDRYYATYDLGLFFRDPDFVWQPCDFRFVGPHRAAGYILGVDPAEERPRLVLVDESRPLREPYVCIATQSTAQCKYWNNPDGWRSLTEFLVAAGYRVICIDQKPSHGAGDVWNFTPKEAEDETGDRPLQERARWLKHCEFFIGLSSGISWLAWAAGCPVVMISGFTHPLNEFFTPYRVINYQACNSCWNDRRVMLDFDDFMWCPRHRNTPRQFECSRLITVDQVIAAIRKVPQFVARQQGRALARY